MCRNATVAGKWVAAYGVHLKVPDVLALALDAFLYKTVTMQLCQLVARDARPQVQAVHIL